MNDRAIGKGDLLMFAMIDAYFRYELGTLEYRSVRFETEVLDIAPNPMETIIAMLAAYLMKVDREILLSLLRVLSNRSCASFL